MPAGQYDITIEQGETFSRVLTWQDSGGTPINLTGYTARMDIRRSSDALSAVLSLTDGNGRITLGGALGTITLTIAATDTASLPEGFSVYDLELVSSSNSVTKLLRGNVIVNPEVTR